MIRRLLLPIAAMLLLAGAAPLDSQYVLQRYAVALDALPMPKAVVYTYTISQAGPTNIEQRHRVYRSGVQVRDETLAVDGVALARKVVNFARRDDRYAVGKIAPRSVEYQMLFLHSVKNAHHYDYLYETSALIHAPSAIVERITIDGTRYLPLVVKFRTESADSHGVGEIDYAPFGKYWMPVVATVDATVNGRPARERIVWSDYRFPDSLPAGTFFPPKPLPKATLPPI